ncbi:MAG: ArsR/SmtB family transcription factor [Candidatus Saccharibacteria bacterium]
MDRKEDIERVVTESPDSVAKMLRGAAHPARVMILASLATEHGEFSALIERTRLSKNALVNHLNQLIDLGLVRRALRGEYALTDDGRALILAVANTYRCSVRRREMEDEARRRALVLPDGVIKMTRKVLTRPASFQGSWISYYGAMASLFASQGIKCDPAEVAGRSGYAFIINVARGKLCPSGPTALGMEAWVQIREGTETAGFLLEHWTDYSASEGGSKPSVKELEKMKRLFDRVCNEIDRGRPAVVWGLGLPEYGIVNGYSGDAYIASIVLSRGEPDVEIKYYQLDAPGCYDAYFIKGPNTRKDDPKQALARALRFASGEVGAEKGYINGLQALADWADALESSEADSTSYLGNSYVGECTVEARHLASVYLGRLAKTTGRTELESASKAYLSVSEQMAKFTALFPFAPQGELKPADRMAGATLLREALDLERTAIEKLRAAWEALE